MGRKAFTLLEMLAAMAMIVVIAASLYASLHIAFRARDTALRTVQQTRACNAAFGLLKEDLQSALVTTRGILGGPFVGMPAIGSAGGEADTLSFYMAAPADAESNWAPGDVRFVEYLCEPSPDATGDVLVRRMTDNLLAPVVAEPNVEPICRGVRSFTLRYFDGADWLDNWDSNAVGVVLPAAVEVTLELMDPAASSRDAATYRMSRVLPLPCGQAIGSTVTTDAISTLNSSGTR